jgi:integrase
LVPGAVPHADASEGFSDEEVAAILDSADCKTAWLVGRGDDPEFTGRLLRVLLYTGIHISNLCGRRPQLRGKWEDGRRVGTVQAKRVAALTSGNITETIIGGQVVRLLAFRRVKKDEDNVTHVPISRHLWPWLPEFLDQPKPKTRARYAQMIAALEEDVFTRHGMRLHLNAKRFRHTCMRLLHAEFGFPLADIERIMATTQGTLRRYAERTPAQIAEDLAARGW